VCLVAPRAGFALVTCGHARFCEPCAMRVSEMAAGCPVCRTYITMVIYIFLRLCQPTLQILEHWNKSRDVHPCYIVSRCPVSRCQSPQFWWSRDVRSRVFSRPV